MFASLLYVFRALEPGLLHLDPRGNQIQALQMTMIFILAVVFFSASFFLAKTMP